MAELIEIKINKRVLLLFHFLKDNPTRTLSKGEHVLLTYWKPLGVSLTPFSFKGITVTLLERDRLEYYTADGWQVVRDNSIAYAQNELLDVLGELEREQLRQQRKGVGLLIDGIIFHWLAYGLNDVESVKQFVKTFFKAGYSLEQVIQLYSSIAKPKESLSRAFLALTKDLYTEERR